MWYFCQMSHIVPQILPSMHCCLVMVTPQMSWLLKHHGLTSVRKIGEPIFFISYSAHALLSCVCARQTLALRFWAETADRQNGHRLLCAIWPGLNHDTVPTKTRRLKACPWDALLYELLFCVRSVNLNFLCRFSVWWNLRISPLLNVLYSL